MKAQLFIEALRFAAHAMPAGGKEIRYYLNGVLLELRPGRLTLVGCDGNRCATVTVEHELGHVDADVILAHSSVKDLLKILKPVGQVELVYLAGAVTVNGIPCKIQEGKFPDWRRIMPRTETAEPMRATTVRADHIAEAFNACGRLAAPFKGSKWGAVTQSFYGHNSPCLLEPVGFAFDGIESAAVVVSGVRV